MNTSNVRMLTRYNAWANKSIFDAVAALPEGEATKERNPGERNSNFRNIVHTLNHNYVIDVIWQAHLQGRDHGLDSRNTIDHPALDPLWRAQQAMDEWYVTYSEQLSDTALNEPVHFTLIGGNKGVMTRDAILLHIVNHSTYHRGFVAQMFRQIPAIPPTMDLPVYFTETRQGSFE
ncbi:MAG: DinB family protein [Casimicrobiaceae bacterium]